MSGSRAPATAAAVVNLFIVVAMMPVASVDATSQQGSREADMEFLEYLGTFEAGGEVLDPLTLEQLETDKKKAEKSVKKKRRSCGEERSSDKDAGNE
jgi:ABC-type sulfate transport system substrate-binding protein